jgi:transposase InsO family protein
VLVLVDRLTKYVWLEPTYTTVTAEGTAQLFKDTVIQQMGIPDSVVTDRGSQFVCKFSAELNSLLGVKGCASTAFHPQTDGQTERVNAVLGDMLRHFVGHATHNDWSNTCPVARSL